MKTADLQDWRLDYWTARADGFDDDSIIVRQIEATGHTFVTVYEDERGWVSGSYMNDWRRVGPLIAKHHLNVSETDPPGWVAWSNDLDMEYGDTPLQAICRAVVRAAFGDEVEEVLP